FDAVVNLLSFHHYPNPSRAAAEFRRVLRPGGRLVVIAFDRTSRYITLTKKRTALQNASLANPGKKPAASSLVFCAMPVSPVSKSNLSATGSKPSLLWPNEIKALLKTPPERATSSITDVIVEKYLLLLDRRCPTPLWHNKTKNYEEYKRQRPTHEF